MTRGMFHFEIVPVPGQIKMRGVEGNKVQGICTDGLPVILHKPRDRQWSWELVGRGQGTW